ncbi:cytidine deaminase [Oleiagrimonas sp.]|jgi:cytidine deaminase|uniref:cytidine deaminase n=1 Tax=Oleiagrimonas sp. TaxID=2010330 RepID=UPI002611FA63|nr:cytidine deaminase [Oleiagrimonas sp.]MDA3915254.1 cytidine deaminase [Oleiagrimonas sp.]
MNPEQLMQMARQAREHAYAPYSNFRVGAAVLARDGRVFAGCNVENASYGLCNCAERTAFFSAIAAGVRRDGFVHIAIIGDCEEPISPCGACRQVMAELAGPEVPVNLGNLQGKQRQTTIGDLLPDAFELAPRLKHTSGNPDTP